MRKSICLAVILGFSTCLNANQLTEKWQSRLGTIEETYSSSVLKADKAHTAAIQKSNSERLRALKVAQSDATKRFDVDAATLKVLN